MSKLVGEIDGAKKLVEFFPMLESGKCFLDCFVDVFGASRFDKITKAENVQIQDVASMAETSDGVHDDA